jgi:3-oxoadipate enol-lactonase
MWQERAQTVRGAASVEPLADAVIARWLTPAFAGAHPEVRDTLRSMLVDTPAEGYASCCEAIERMDLRASLPRIAAPTLVVSGSDDPSTPIDHQRLIVEAIPKARHETIAPGAHAIAVEQPDAVNRLILEHLQ